MGRADLAAFAVRFVCGGLVIAAIPLVARRFSPYLAGVLVLIPVVTLLGFLFLGRDEGINAVRHASAVALFGLPALGCFVATVYLLARSGHDVGLTVCAALGVWIALTVPLVLVLHFRSGR